MISPGPYYRARQIVMHDNQIDQRTLLSLLDSVQRKLLARRGGEKTTLVVHGGVVAVLGLQYRSATTDVDYIERVLPEELDIPIVKEDKHPLKRMVGKLRKMMAKMIYSRISIRERVG